MSGSTVLVAVVIAVALVANAIAFGPSLLRAKRDRQLLASGVTAEASVIDLRDTGNRYNGEPEVTIHLEVKPVGTPPFPAEARRVVTTADVGLFARGRTLTVKYDPADLARVAIMEPVQ